MAEPENIATQVAIAGGGPVGLVLALYLDFFGVRSVLFNTEPTSRWHPKGNGQNARVMEIYRRLGFSEDVRRLGLPDDHPFDQAYFTRLSAYEIYRFPQPCLRDRMAMRRDMPVTDQLPEPMYHVNQMYVEKYLLERARGRPNIDVRFGWRVTGVDQDADGVHVRAARTDGPGETVCTAAYAVGCDGGQSTVRRSLGIDYEGDVKTRGAFWAGQFFSVHMRIPDLYPRFLGHRRAWVYWAVNPDPRTRGMIFALNGIDEFMMLVKSADGRTAVDGQEVAGWLREAIGADIPIEVLGCDPWVAGHALVAERYGAGRVLLAGDAVHLFTPTGGFGLSTGIDDTSNLAWKLAAVLQGWGGPNLLATYEGERKPIGYRNTGASRQLAVRQQDLEVSAAVEAAGPEGEAARRAAAETSYVRNNHFNRPEEQDAVGVQLGARYDGSPIIVADGAPPPESLVEYVPSGVPGGRAPHLWLDDVREQGSSLFDRLGPGFTLLRFDPDRETGTLEQAAARRGVPLKVVDVAVPHAAELYDRPLALVRPDHYIAWRGSRLPDDPDALLARVTGF